MGAASQGQSVLNNCEETRVSGGLEDVLVALEAPEAWGFPNGCEEETERAVID